jgi:Sec-independent protein translocase protein TatA
VLGLRRQTTGRASEGWQGLGIVEIILLLAVALIVIPPDDLPAVMQAVGKVLRELRLASNTVMREITGALDEPGYVRREPVDAKGEGVKPADDTASAANATDPPKDA